MIAFVSSTIASRVSTTLDVVVVLTWKGLINYSYNIPYLLILSERQVGIRELPSIYSLDIAVWGGEIDRSISQAGSVISLHMRKVPKTES